MSQVKFYKKNDLNISTLSNTFDDGGIIFKKNTALNPTNNYSRIYTKESEGLVEYYKEDLELFSGTTTKALGNIPAGTDLSSTPKRVIDIIKELLFATYAPKWTDASYTASVTYGEGVPTTGTYIKKGTSKSFKATLTVTGTVASASASEDGTSSGQKRTVNGGNLSKVTCDGVEENATGTNTFTKEKNLTLDTSTITTLNPSSFTLSAIKFLGNDSTTVKDSKGENTKKTGSDYNVELKDATNNSNIDDYFHIKAITLYNTTNAPITSNSPGTYYIYLPIYLSTKLTDTKVSNISSIILDKSSNTNSSSSVVDFNFNDNTTYTTLSDGNSFKLETSSNYIGFVIPSQGNSSTQRPFIVLPSGYTISEIYTEALSGQAEILNNASSHNALWYTKSDSPTEINGQNYYKFTLNLKDNSGAGPVILKIVTE